MYVLDVAGFQILLPNPAAFQIGLCYDAVNFRHKIMDENKLMKKHIDEQKYMQGIKSQR